MRPATWKCDFFWEINAPKTSKCKWFHRVLLRVPGEGTRMSKFFPSFLQMHLHSCWFVCRRWPGTRKSKCFWKYFPLCFCWFVWWLLVISGSSLWRGAPMERKLLAAVMTKPSRFGTRNLENASRRWPPTRNRKFFYQYARTTTKKTCSFFECL